MKSQLKKNIKKMCSALPSGFSVYVFLGDLAG